MSKEILFLAVALVYADRVGFSKPPPLNPDGSVPYEAIAEWFDRVCYYASEDPSEHAERFAQEIAEIDDMVEST